MRRKTFYTLMVISINGVFFPEAYATETTGYVYKFDASLIKNHGEYTDLTIFEQGAQLPGIYPVDVLLNGKKVDSSELAFHIEKDPDGKPFLKTCLSREMLIRYGVKVEDYPSLFPNNSESERVSCADLSAIPQSTETFQFSEQKLLLGIPQIALRPEWSGIAPVALWDDGLSALLMNYQISANRTHYKGYGRFDSNALWSNLEPGLNIGPWRLRNMTTWQKQSGQNGKWTSVYTRAERGLNSIKSRLTFGEFYTPSDIFDSVSLRGVMLSSDDSMVPYNQRSFAPVVRGIAQTQSRVEVRQNGYLIYSTTVAPGEFALNDLPVTGSGGDLQVTVHETNGTTQEFIVPFTTPAISLHQGYLKYSISGGQYRSPGYGRNHINVEQASVMYGLPWNLTAYGGVQGAEHYLAGALGIGVSMGSFGALSVDGTHTRGQQKGQDTRTGYSWRTRYSKSYPLTGTNFTAANYQYSSEGYHTLSDVLNTYQDGNASTIPKNNRYQRTTLILSQSLGKWGYLSLNSSQDKYRNSLPSQNSWGASYSTSWKGISWSVSWAENRVTRDYIRGKSQRENNFSLWINVPLKRWIGGNDNDIHATGQIQTGSGQGTQYEAGVNGRAFDRRLYWDIREQLTSGNTATGDNSNINLTWDGTYGEVTGNYSYNKNVSQMSAGISGGIVAYNGGVIFSQRLGDTTAIIEAPGADGVSVNNWPGVRTDFRGYTTQGYLAPYNENIITLNPTTLPEDVEIPQTDVRIVPTKGAVVPASFITRVGGRALINILRAEGKPAPFGAIVTLQGDAGKNNDAGVVGENGEVYMSGLPAKGELLVQWGNNHICHATYRLPEKKGPAGVYLTQAVCK